MFDKSLLDSSHPSVLTSVHWIGSLLAGISAFVLASLTLPVGLTPAATKFLLLRAAVAGAVVIASCLAACYAYFDARRQELNSRVWLAVVILGNLPGFLAYLVYSAAKTGDWKRATLPIAYTLEVLFIGAAAMVPLIYTQVLPRGIRELVTVPIVPARGNPPARNSVQIHRAARTPNVLEAPRIIPTVISTSDPVPQVTPDEWGVAGAVPGMMPGIPNGVFSSLVPLGNTTPPPLPEKPKPVQRIVRGGSVEAAHLIYSPKPAYPHLAVVARIQGTVKLKAIIARDGTVQELNVLDGHPLLVPAATKAVARWRYQPTLLNGEPVEVETEIDVNFVLGQ